MALPGPGGTRRLESAPRAAAASLSAARRWQCAAAGDMRTSPSHKGAHSRPTWNRGRPSGAPAATWIAVCFFNWGVLDRRSSEKNLPRLHLAGHNGVPGNGPGLRPVPNFRNPSPSRHGVPPKKQMTLLPAFCNPSWRCQTPSLTRGWRGHGGAAIPMLRQWAAISMLIPSRCTACFHPSTPVFRTGIL